MYKRSSIILIIFLLAYPIPVFSQLTTPTLPSPFPAVKGSGIFDKGEGLARLSLRGTSGQGGGEKTKFLYNQDIKRLEYVPGELLVKFRSGVPRHLAQATHRFLGSSAIKRFRRINVDHIKIPEGWSVEEAMEIYLDDPDVEYAEPNYYRYATAIPNDTEFGKLWGLHNTGQSVNGTSGTADADIDAPEAWDTQTGSSNVVIAVLDTGADWNHEDLSDNIWSNSDESPDNRIDNDENGYKDDIRGWDFVNGDNDPDDDNASDYHGTHVSGTIGAKGNNNVGITGVCWSASIMPLKILDAAGSGTVDLEIEAIDYAIANGAKIINASFGGPSYSRIEYEAIQSARDASLLFVAATGNDGRDNDSAPVYPASYNLDNIISVAASDFNDDLALWSNYGYTSVDVAAPGVDVYSTKAGDNYQYQSGTSMAAPHVSGLAALIWSGDNSLPYRQVRDRILNGVDVLATMNGKVLMSGRINANNSINTPPHEPALPSHLVASPASSNQIDLIWTDNSSDESGFKIDRMTGSEGTYSQIATVGADAESYSDTDLSEVTTYYYRVSAFNSAGNSDYSNEANANTYPAAPSDLSATAVSTSQIDLIWTDNSSGEEGFKIARKMGSGGTYSQIATVDEDVISYSDTELSEVTTYYYRVRAYNSAGNSDYSNEANANTYPAAPSDLSATAVSTSQIDLIWTDNSSGEEGFKIARKMGSGGTYSQIATVTANAESYGDTGLSESTTYYYRVSAYNSNGSSSYSNEANATTLSSSSGGGGGGDGCFIATAAYGSPMEPHVKVLRQLRDCFLLTTSVGGAFVDLYYTSSPPGAGFIARHDTVRLAVRWSLLPLVGLSYVAIYLGPAAALGLVVLLLCLVGASGAIAVSRMRLRHQA